jgi:hypothetical protein
MPPKKFKAKRNQTAEKKRKDALRRVKQRWEDAQDATDDSSVFEPAGQVAVGDLLRAADGGIPAVLTALRAYNEPDAREFIEFYDSLTAYERKYLTIDEIAYASGVGSLRLSEIAQSAMIVAGKLKASMLVTSSMYKVLKSTIKAATDEVPIVADTLMGRIVVGKTNGDTKAMEMFHKISGMMPTPKGSQIAIQLNQNNKSDDGEEDEGPEGRPAWMDSGQRLREIHDLTDQRRLPAPKTEPVHIGGRLDAMQVETADILSKGE